jgi:AraC-like DNA-binding protein
MRDALDSRGILNPRGGQEYFTIERREPSGADLAPVVERYWCVRWDLRGRAPYEQETLPWPCVNLVLGTHRPGVHGVYTTRFVAKLEGAGWVIGTKFRPGGFRPFVSVPLAELTDRAFPVEELFPGEGADLVREVHAAGDDARRIALVEAFLRARKPVHDADAAVASRLVELARSEPSIRRAGDLAARANLSPRGLQRLFRVCVGVSPKWVIRRFRVHEVADRLAVGAPVDAAALALECGYFDQAHFIRDFKAQVGRTPGEYAALCAASARARGGFAARP